MISVHFQGKPFNITLIQVYAPTNNAEEAEVEWFYEDLQDLLELTCKRDVLFIIGDWNAKVGRQETPRVTGKFGLGVWNEAGQRLIDFCQHASIPKLLPPVPLIPWQVTVNPHLCWRLQNTYRQIRLSILWGHSSFLLGPSGHKLFQESLFAQSCGSSIIKPR